MRYLLYSALVICFCIAFVGCTPDSQQSSPNPAAKHAAKKKTPKASKTASKSDAVKQTPQVKEPYNYTSAGKPDPFRPLLADVSAKFKASGDDNRNKAFLTPLQKYELDDLKLVAVVVLDSEPTAMLEDPTGYGYVIHKGMLIGPNDGFVERVTSTGLIVKEKFYNSLGEIESKISTLTIQHVE
jgi:type IV pilus assembly protein PilP